jgi:hypothetical protein
MTLAEPIFERCRTLPRRWKLYLKVARRVLGIGYFKDQTVMQLPLHYEKRLRRLGLCQNPAATAQFQRLTPDLEIDASGVIFAESRPYLIENTRRLLRGEAPELGSVASVAVAEADTLPPGSCGYLMRSSEDPSYTHIKSPFKIAKVSAKGSPTPRFEPSNDSDDAEW